MEEITTVQAGSVRGDQGKLVLLPPPVVALGIIGQVTSRLHTITYDI